MKTILLILIPVMLYGCSQFYQGELRNLTENDVEVKVCGNNLKYVNHDGGGEELNSSDSCRIFRLRTNKTMLLASASGVNAPLMFDDLGFFSLQLKTKNGLIYATDKEIMNLFQIEKIKGLLGVNTGIVYHIDIRN